MLQFVSRTRGAVFILTRYRQFSGKSCSENGSKSFAVMSFGDGSHGALGLPSSLVGVGGDAYEPTIVPGLPSGVVNVSAGHYHSLALTSEGELWAWGRNEEGQLGRGLLAPRHSWNEPQRVEGLTNVKVRAAFASGVISVAIGDDGSMWTWGRSKRGQLGLGKGIIEAVVPSRVEGLAGEDIAKVSLGWGHALARTTDGKLFGWGYSADGRLGRIGGTVETSPLDSGAKLLGRRQFNPKEAFKIAEEMVLESMEKEKDMPILWVPREIEELQSVPVTDISCGPDHSLVISYDGMLLSGGSNTYSQLGRQIQDPGLLPVNIDFSPLSSSCGAGHSMAICKIPVSNNHNTTDSIILSWGWNHNSQLGRKGDEEKPLVVEGLSEETPISVSCGRVHSICITKGGELWVWGCGKNGRLGLGSSIDEPEPTPVDIGGYKVIQGVAGFDHNLLLVAET